MKNESILYLECHSGISGDMTVAALLDLGADEAVLREALASLPLSGYSIEIRHVYKSGLRACDFLVVLDEEHENHDHDMSYLHPQAQIPESGPAHGYGQLPHTHAEEHIPGHDHENPPAHSRGQLPPHVHAGDHTHGHNHENPPAHSHGQLPHTHAGDHTPGHDHTNPPAHSHPHAHFARNLQDIIRIINAGQLTDGAKALAIRMFEIVAQAEAQVHGKPVDEVHFHEVGAVDSIVDIVAAAVCIDQLHPDRILVSPLADGTGQIRCQHGLIPVPVPAVTAIAANEHLTLRPTAVYGELVTPTGAAIAAAVRSGDTLPDTYQIRRVGLGAGKRDYPVTGVLRAMLLDAQLPEHEDSVLVLETNIDDCSGEAVSFALRQLMAAGALDAFCIPIFMKKNRPAYLLKVICEPADQAAMEELLFCHTTTIGIRRQNMQRTKLAREIITLDTPWGPADIKRCSRGSEVRCYPENDSVSRLAVQHQTGFTEMYGLLQAYAREHLV